MPFESVVDEEKCRCFSPHRPLGDLPHGVACRLVWLLHQPAGLKRLYRLLILAAFAQQGISSRFSLTMYGIIPYTWSLKERYMMPREQSRTGRIEARISPDALAVVKQAADLEGRSISEFVVAAAQEAARRTIEQAHIIRLSLDDQRRFVDLLLNPPAPSPALQRANEAHDRLIRESR